MPDLALTTANYGRPRLSLPQVRLVNAYVESSPGGPSSAVRTPRPGLTREWTLDSGPIYGIFQQPGLFGGDVFTLSGGKFYRNNVFVKEIAYGVAPQFAAANGLLAIVSGGGLYIYNGVELIEQQFYDDGVSRLPSFSGVAVLYNIFVYPEAGSDKFWFSATGNPASINGLSFSTCQTNPDKIVQCSVLAEELYFFGEKSTEIWSFTGNYAAPFQLSQGRTYTRGCSNQSSVRLVDNSLFWVGDDYTVYRSGQVPSRLSTSFIEDRLRENGPRITSLKYEIEGHVVYVLNFQKSKESYAYDCQTGEWFCIGTLNDYVGTIPSIFQGAVSTGQGLTQWVGSYNDGRVFKFDVNNHTDDGVPIQVVVSGGIVMTEGVQKCTNVSLHMVRGIATTNEPDPICRMRYSDDGGRTFTSWINGDLGGIGKYSYKATWRSLGIIKQPGRLFEFLVADTVNFTVEGASYNAARV